MAAKSSNATSGDAGKKSLQEVREELATLKEVLEAFRENDGKDEIVEEIIREASKMPQDRRIGCLALIHGPAEMANKLTGAVADFSINAALVISVTWSYAFECPQAVAESDKEWVRPAFTALIYASVFCHVSCIIIMMYVNTAMNAWAREADLLAILWRGGHHIWTLLMNTFALGIILAMIAAVIATYADTDDALYWLTLPGGLLMVMIYAVWPGTALYMGTTKDFDFLANCLFLLSRPSNVWTDSNKIMMLGIDKKMKKQGKDVSDFFDTPFDVLRKQAELGKMLDDDAWRQKELKMAEVGAAEGNANDAVVMDVSDGTAERSTRDTLVEALNKVEAGFGELYWEKMVGQSIDMSTLPLLTRTDMVSVLGMPLGHAVKIERHFQSC